MCGRYTLAVDLDDLKEEMGLEELPPPGEMPKRFNVAPSQPVPVVIDRAPRKVELFHWGLLPHWEKDPKKARKPINLRAESLAQGGFRSTFERRRCLILADGFYEWKREGKKKQPFYIHLASGKPFGFAGVWEVWRDAEGNKTLTCAIVTQDANRVVAPIHARMPVILRPEVRETWLSKLPIPPGDLEQLLAPLPDEVFEAYPVSSLVNKPDNDGPDLLTPQRESASDPDPQLRLPGA